MDTVTKVCSRCKLEKPAAEFAKSTSQKDGLHVKCRSCESIYQKERRAARKLAAEQSAEMHGLDLESAESELDLEPA